ncbi:MAG: leucine-rich repeat domain-containing protein, partial [Muribaculaceae bacterium]|nr:leucine-rich repeat domain-containing protein [Muribaculaceae bacterium]
MKKWLLLSLLCVSLAIATLHSQTIELNGMKYVLDAQTKTAVASFADAEMTDVVVEPSVAYEGTEYQVIKLSDQAFFGCRGLKSVKLPSTIKTIGGYAFMACSELERVYIPALGDWLEIEFVNTFSNPLFYANDLYVDNTLLKDLILPEGLTKVPDNAFAGASLTTLTMPSSLNEIGSHSFYECTSLKTLKAGESLAVIGIQAFDGCSSLRDVELSPSVTDVKGWAFNDCKSLKTVTFGAKVNNVGTDAFAGCNSLEAINIFDITSWCKIEFANEKANPLVNAHVLQIDGKAITKLEIPAGITEIKEGAFAGCTAIESVVLGADLTKIGPKAFNACPALRSVIFEGSVTTIDSYAFEGCPLLADCYLPESLTTRGEYGLWGTVLTQAV